MVTEETLELEVLNVASQLLYHTSPHGRILQGRLSENDLRVKEGTGRRIPSDSEVSQAVRSFINQDLELGQPMN